MIITITVFSVIVLGLAGLAFQIARRSTRATDEALKMAAQLSAVDKAATTPYDSLALLLRADTTLNRGIQVVVRYEVDSLSVTRKDVRCITTTSVAGSRPDTIVVPRGRIRYPIPLR